MSVTSGGGASRHRAPGLHTPAQQVSSVRARPAQCSSLFFGSSAIARLTHTARAGNRRFLVLKRPARPYKSPMQNGFS